MNIAVLLFFSNLFSTDMVIIVFVALLLFGGEKLPEIARGLGKGIRDFKDASEGVKREINNQINSFEVEREEKKMAENAAAQQAVQAEPVAESGHLIEAHQTVPNTIPVSDSYTAATEPAPAGGGLETHTDVVVGEPAHTGAVTEVHESTKNL